MNYFFHTEKTPQGWWRVCISSTDTQQEVWIPSNHVQRKRRLKSVVVSNPTNSMEMFTTISEYTSTDANGLSFQPGEVVELLEKDPTGKIEWGNCGNIS